MHVHPMRGSMQHRDLLAEGKQVALVKPSDREINMNK